MYFLDKEFFKSDYDSITRTLISDNVTYEQTSKVLREIADNLFDWLINEKKPCT